jgi:pimeloyl-ACP methyl ester carboxylesterase
MKYFNGFSLKGEEELFEDYIINSNYTIAGFSYGAIKAFEYVYNSKKRVDRLILLSPAFFQNQKRSFKKVQLKYFKLNQKEYIDNFLKNITYPSDINLYKYLDIGTYEQLEILLSYEWKREQILEVINRGVTIEIFIGGEDKIVNPQDSFDFFSIFATTYFIKSVGHILK